MAKVQFVAMLMMSLAGCGSTSRSTNPFPDAADIEKVEFKGGDGSDPKAVVIEKEEWQAIAETMLPAYRDTNPAKWVMYRGIQITLKNGKQITVWPMRGPDPKAAFAIGDSWENRTYYIGGSNVQLQEAMERVSK